MKPKEEKTGSKNGTSELMNEPNVHPSFLLPIMNNKINFHLKSSFFNSYIHDFINFILDSLDWGPGLITLLKSCHLTQVRWKEMKGDEVRNGMKKSDASGNH